MEILAVKNLTFTYPQCKAPALSNVSFAVNEGDFVAVCGATGSGKTTLLRMLKRELTPQGDLSGEIRCFGKDIAKLSALESACLTGFVMQRPEQQIVTDKVWHELAFGAESINLKTPEIRRRVAEISGYFGIEEWFDKDVSQLSGGQKQLLNLASVMVMQPKLLLLDEPTAQLDPIAASEFLTTVRRLNVELGMTVIIVEHRAEEVIPLSNKLLVMDSGAVLTFGETKAVCEKMRGNEKLMQGMPAAVRLFDKTGACAPCPLTVTQAREYIKCNFGNEIKCTLREEKASESKAALELQNVWFRYSHDAKDVLRGTSLKVNEGEIFCILGGNGSGKTTALKAMAGVITPYAGKISAFGKSIKKYPGRSLYKNCLAMLVQDVQTVFYANTVDEELKNANADISDLPYDLSPLRKKHPYDLSGGEQQLVALAKVLAAKPRILLMDEPTKGIDACMKNKITSVLQKLRNNGVAVVIVTHDVEFAAACADRCALFFRGEITCVERPRDFFCGNSFYTTAANRMARGYYDDVITVEDAARLCLANRKPGGGAA